MRFILGYFKRKNLAILTRLKMLMHQKTPNNVKRNVTEAATRTANDYPSIKLLGLLKYSLRYFAVCLDKRFLK